MIRFDEIGAWSELKLEVLRKYATAYSTILTKQERFEHFYVDGFSGAGLHISKSTGERIPGSPRIALEIEPPFSRYFFIDLNGDKAAYLQESVGDRTDVEVIQGDCNEILLGHVFPQLGYADFRRALCVLDPYGLQLEWAVIQEAGRLGTLDLFLNFPVMDMNRNALWRNPGAIDSESRARMNRFWGDETWFDATYEQSRQLGLFADEAAWLKGTNEQVAEAFRQRLKQVAGFAHVARPLPMKNSKGATVYYLIFASRRPVATGIVDEIFDSYR